MYQALNGLKYLRDMKILHRDIKGILGFLHLDIIEANILITRDGVLKICDFGLARKFNKENSQTAFSGDKITMNYRPPEMLLTTSPSRYTTAVDVWSMGVVFLNLLKGNWVIFGKNPDEVLRCIVHYLGTRRNKEKMLYILYFMFNSSN